MWIPMTIKKLSSSSLTALAFSTALALAAAASMTVHAGVVNNGLGAAVASATALAPGDAFAGVLPHTQPMHVVVALKLRNSEQLSSLIAAHQTLTPAQFSAQHAPTQLQAQAVATYLTQLGFTHVVIAPNRLLVSADGTAGTAQAAFQTSFARVQTHDGRAAFANTSDAHVPTYLQGSVLSVIGLQNVHQAHSFAQRLQPNAITAAAGSVTGHNPNEFPAIYNATGLPTAAGITVGIIAVGDQSQTITDLNTFTDNNQLTRVITQIINTNGTGPVNEQGEWDLDSQDIVGAGGGQVGKLIFYTDPDFSFVGLIDNFNTAMTANLAKVINVSIGGCENDAQSDGSAAASDQIFQAAVAQGQTFSVSTGDKGANECQGEAKSGASWPASSPYVVAVAGTTLNASTTTWNSEIVWNVCDGGSFCATGGSPSTFEPKPSWQDSLVSGNTRGVADLSFDADANSGALIVVNGGIQQWGGTSLSSPIFVGFWARVIAAKGTAVGFAAPLLYQLPAADFRDVTVGNNNGYQAKAGYDFATGRGSLIMSSVINDIGVVGPPPPPPPLVANFSFTTSGRIAKFTDTSTDSSHPITAHAWTFGDGGTSRIASPSHVYLKLGTYTVNETVTDSTGLAANKTASVTIK
jgi:subtilase family serine protease